MAIHKMWNMLTKKQMIMAMEWPITAKNQTKMAVVSILAMKLKKISQRWSESKIINIVISKSAY